MTTAYGFPACAALQASSVVVTVQAAGVHRTKWVALPTAERSLDRARSIMQERRFDVLPVEDAGTVRAYFQTSSWNDYTHVALQEMRHSDLLYHGMPVRDGIRTMATEKRSFYFLLDDRTVVGLFSLAHLSRRPVKLFLFGLLSELETRLAALVSNHVSDAEVATLAFGSSVKDKHRDVRKRLDEDRKSGVDLPMAEYLFLSDLVNVAQKRKLYGELKLGAKQFKRMFGSITHFRDAVAHPARTLLGRNRGVQDLWRQIDEIEDALFRLRDV